MVISQEFPRNFNIKIQSKLQKLMNNFRHKRYRFDITHKLCLFDGSKPKNNDELQPRLSNLFKNFDSNGGVDLCYQGGLDQRSLELVFLTVNKRFHDDARIENVANEKDNGDKKNWLNSTRLWNTDENLEEAQGNREAEVFQVSNNDAAMAQRWLEDKQLEEKTNTDCLVKDQEKVHLGIKVGANITVTKVPGQEGAGGNVAEKEKVKESMEANVGKLLKYNAWSTRWSPVRSSSTRKR
ncbi:hypothetical protein Tco_0486786 [Tanacetum coccineum]